MEEKTTKTGTKAKEEAPKVEETKVAAKPVVSVVKFPELEQYRDDIRSNNIRVILFVGHENSPSHFEVQLNDMANEIKSSMK